MRGVATLDATRTGPGHHPTIDLNRGVVSVWVSTPDARCQEDEACWDCTTMGNLQCGVGVQLPDTSVPAPESGGLGEGLFAVLLIAALLVSERTARR